MDSWNYHLNTISWSVLFLISGCSFYKLIILLYYLVKGIHIQIFSSRNQIITLMSLCRAMSELRILRLFGNPLVFLPDILPLHQLRHLSLANIRVVADNYLRSVNVQTEVMNSDLTFLVLCGYITALFMHGRFRLCFISNGSNKNF